MWIRPEEFIEVGDRVVVPYRMGGHARHTGIEVEFAFAHVFTMRDEKVVRLDVFESKAAALEAVQARRSGPAKRTALDEKQRLCFAWKAAAVEWRDKRAVW